MNKKYYNCFSYRQMKFLTEEKGHTVLDYIIHHETKKRIWVFIVDRYLSESLTEWTKSK